MTPWDCNDCGVEAWALMEQGRRVHEDFYVTNDLWRSTVPEHDMVLCIGCFEARLGRELRHPDFTVEPRDLFGDPPSVRFRQRWATP